MSAIPKPGAASAASKANVEVEVQAVEAPKANSKPIAVEASTAKSTLIAVEAIEKGFYDNSRKNPGDKFHIKSEKELSKNWMIKL